MERPRCGTDERWLKARLLRAGADRQLGANVRDVTTAEQSGCGWIGNDISSNAVELVNMRLQQPKSYPFHNRLVTAHTDIDARLPHPQNRHVPFGRQAGRCNGWRSEFPFRTLEVDHVGPAERRRPGGGWPRRGCHAQLMTSGHPVVADHSNVNLSPVPGPMRVSTEWKFGGPSEPVNWLHRHPQIATDR